MPQTGIERNRQLNILKIRHFRDIKYHTCDNYDVGYNAGKDSTQKRR